MKDAASKTATLVEALPYIRSWRGRTVVVKIGGAALDDVSLASLVADDIALLTLVGIKVVVVHGGGPQVSAEMDRAGIEPRFVGGLRVTDDASLRIVRHVLVGTINGDLVGRLTGAGAPAVGLNGSDGHLIIADRTTEGELGRVGTVASIRPDLLHALLTEGYTPVVASVAPTSAGELLNVNADAVAGAVATAMHAEKLVFLTNVDGLYRDLGDRDSLMSEVKLEELLEMIPTLSQGMRPKAEAAAAALQARVGKVHILDGRVAHALLLEIFTDEGIGTQVLP
jgi:acetylglutamate kinase